MAATTENQRLTEWVDQWAAVFQPDAIHWCDGSAEEYDALAESLVASGTFTRLDEAKRPNSYWAHSDPGDVARVTLQDADDVVQREMVLTYDRVRRHAYWYFNRPSVTANPRAMIANPPQASGPICSSRNRAP